MNCEILERKKRSFIIHHVKCLSILGSHCSRLVLSDRAGRWN